MRCERSIKTTLFLLMLAACSRETPAPEPPKTAAPPPVVTNTSALPPMTQPSARYEDAVDWLRSAPELRFTVRDGALHAEGTMERATVGAETIEATVDGQQWRAKSGPQGVAWERRDGGAWAAADTPTFGSRLWQRVTLAFDPQKKEGTAQLVADEAGSVHYRFTDANSGDVHDVWVSKTGGYIERITIGDAVEMKFEIPQVQ